MSGQMKMIKHDFSITSPIAVCHRPERNDFMTFVQTIDDEFVNNFSIHLLSSFCKDTMLLSSAMCFKSEAIILKV